jgi:hypothetical protein
MSRQTALANIFLQADDRWGHTEYSLEYHTELLQKYGGATAYDEIERRSRAFDRFAMDFIWHTQDGLIEWDQAGRVTDMGHASYAIDGSDQRPPRHSPFQTPEDVWSFDAVTEYGLPDFAAQVQAYERLLEQTRQLFPGQLTTGGYYKTIVSGAIQAFGWEMLLEAAANPTNMERVFDSFFRRTYFFMQAWAETSVDVVIQHDDFVWTSGPFMNPAIYRNMIIPRYQKLWEPLREAGKKVLFCSDGNFMLFAADILAAGADGLIFEPCNDFEFMVNSFGRKACMVGSCVDCRDLTFDNWDKVQADIDKTLALLQKVDGAIIAVGNHLPPNIPLAMMERYFDYLLPRLERR